MRQFEPFVDGQRLADVVVAFDDDAVAVLGEHIRSVVDRAVVQNNQLDVRVVLFEDAVDRFLEKAGAIKGRHDDGDERKDFERNSGRHCNQPPRLRKTVSRFCPLTAGSKSFRARHRAARTMARRNLPSLRRRPSVSASARVSGSSTTAAQWWRRQYHATKLSAGACTRMGRPLARYSGNLPGSAERTTSGAGQSKASGRNSISASACTRSASASAKWPSCRTRPLRCNP